MDGRLRRQSLARNCQICGDRGKTLKFADVPQIPAFCQYRDASEKFTALRLYMYDITECILNY